MPIANRLRSLPEIEEARTAFETVFQTADPFDQPFQAMIKARDLMYPVGFCLDTSEIRVIASAAAQIGEREAYISITEGYRRTEWVAHDHWRISLSEDFYPALLSGGFAPIMENAIYSVAGSWGILISHEQHAVVGGSREFVTEVNRHLPEPRERLTNFLAFWEENRERFKADLSWIRILLEHLYGSEQAAQLLIRR